MTNSTSCNAVKAVLNRDQHVLLTTLVWLHLLRAGFRMARYAGLWLKSSTLGSPSHLERFVEFGLGCLEPFRNRTEVSQSFFSFFLFGKTLLNSNLDRVRQLFFQGNVVIRMGPCQTCESWSWKTTLRWSGNDSSHWDQVCCESSSSDWSEELKNSQAEENAASGVVKISPIKCRFKNWIKLKSLVSIHTVDKTLH